MRFSLLLPIFLLLLLAAVILTAAAAPAPSAAPTSSTAPATRKASNDSTPNLITLHYTKADPALVLKDLFTQIDFPYEIFPGSTATWPRLTINVDTQPYWQVVTTIDDTLSTLTYVMMPDRKIRVGQTSGNRTVADGLRCISGSSLFIATTIHNRVDFTDPDHTPNCAVDIVYLAEPHLQIATFPSRCQPDLALDENGQSLLCDPAPPSVTQRPSETFIKFQIDLARPPAAGQRIAQLKGLAHLTVADQPQTFNFPGDKLTEPNSIDLDGAELTLLPLKHDGIVYRLRIEAAIGNQSPEEWESTNALLDAITITVLDENDTPLYNPPAVGNSGRGTDLRTLSNNFSQYERYDKDKLIAGPPAKCRITLPRYRDLKIPYEFKNIPLP